MNSKPEAVRRDYKLITILSHFMYAGQVNFLVEVVNGVTAYPVYVVVCFYSFGDKSGLKTVDDVFGHR